MSNILKGFGVSQNENVLVGLHTSDDAGVYKLNDEQALVQTLDFFTPIVDDPYLFGQIAAANSLSDVYAMGGKPITALNIVAFPLNCLDGDILRQVLEGGASKIAESGAVLLGGHTIEDEEPKYGLSVTGVVHPDKYWSNAFAKEGQILILTKPIGTGIIASAVQGELIKKENEQQYQTAMATLNKYAAEILLKYDVRGVTDITGFGLLGHALEMAKASKVTLNITAEAVPLLPQTKEMAEMGFLTAGGYNNLLYAGDYVDFHSSLDELWADLLFDPQTSGGLLASVNSEDLPYILEDFKNNNCFIAVIGKVEAYQENDRVLLVR